MGGQGSGRLNKESTIVRNLTYNPFVKSRHESILLPDKSGDHTASIMINAPTKDEQLVNKKYADGLFSNVIPKLDVLPAVEVGKVIYLNPAKRLYLGID